MSGSVKSALGPRLHLRMLLAIGLCCALAGCVTTRAWEREDLANPVMQLDPLPGHAALRAHLLGVQEGAIGGFGSGGGGCGCN